MLAAAQLVSDITSEIHAAMHEITMGTTTIVLTWEHTPSTASTTSRAPSHSRTAVETWREMAVGRRQKSKSREDDDSHADENEWGKKKRRKTR